MSFELERTPDGVDLVVTGDWSPAATAALMDGRADGMVLNYARGFRTHDLAFLRGLPVRRLHLLARTVSDLSAVYWLAGGLVSLRVQSDPRAVIELDRLPLLRSVSATWAQVHGSICFAGRLEELFLLSYGESDLTPLAPATSLRSIVLKDRPAVRSLDGMQHLPQLIKLGVHLAPMLGDVAALQMSTSPRLTDLALPACRRIGDISPVAACTALQALDLSEGGDLPTVAVVGGLTELERLYLYGSTKVLDSDLSPIAGLPKLRDFRMQSRRTYSPSVRDIQDAIARRP